MVLGRRGKIPIAVNITRRRLFGIAKNKGRQKTTAFSKRCTDAHAQTKAKTKTIWA